MQVEKFYKLIDIIKDAEDQKRFFMGFWSSTKLVSPTNGITYYSNNCELENATIDKNNCNTAGCIGGWAMCMEGNGITTVPTTTNFRDIETVIFIGAYILGLSWNQAQSLFDVYESPLWGQHFKECYVNNADVTAQDAITVLKCIAEGVYDLNQTWTTDGDL